MSVIANLSWKQKEFNFETENQRVANKGKVKAHELVNVVRFYNKLNYHSYTPEHHLVLINVDKITIVKPQLGVRKPKAEENIKKINELPKKRNGEMSRATRNKCKQLLFNWLITLDRQWISYKHGTGKKMRMPVCLTLTLSSKQQHEDKFIYRNMLMPFIQDLKRDFGLANYFWRAETQGNGNIHYHLIVDCYINKYELQRKWNRIQEKFGYLDGYKYLKGHGNAPSTHIEATNIKGAIHYITKYLAKDESSRRLIAGQLWGCSDALRNLPRFALEISPSILERISQLLEGGEAIVRVDDYFDVICVKNTFSFLNSLGNSVSEIRDFTTLCKKILYENYEPSKRELKYGRVYDDNDLTCGN